VLTAKKGLDSDDPAQTLGLIEAQVFLLTNDGLTGFRKVGGSG
jgi:hypothetical protein